MTIKNRIFKRKIESTNYFKSEGATSKTSLLSSSLIVSGLLLIQASPIYAMKEGRENEENVIFLKSSKSQVSTSRFYNDFEHPLTQGFWKENDVSERLKTLTKNIEKIKEKIIKCNNNFNLIIVNGFNISEFLRCSSDGVAPIPGLSEIKFEDLLINSHNKQNSNNGLSGADVSPPLFCNKTKVVIKRFHNIEEGLKELLHSLVALQTNPWPTDLKMARIYDATICSQNSKDCLSIIMECAKGEDINTCLSTLLAKNAVKACAEYLATFHIKNHQKLTENIDRKKYIDHIANAYHTLLYDPLNEEGGQITLLDLSIGKVSLDLDEVKSDNIIRSLPQEKQEKFKALVKESCDQLKNNTYKIFDLQAAGNQKPYFLTITHGDAHGGNFFYDEETLVQDIFKRITMIDFGSIIRTYGDIGDPAEDVGRFLGSLWEWAAQKSSLEPEHINLEIYDKIIHLQDKFVKSYLNTIEKHKHFTYKNKKEFKKTFKENCNFYKLRFYRVIFNSKQDKNIKLKILNSWMKENSALKTSLDTRMQKSIMREESEDRTCESINNDIVHCHLPERSEVFIESAAEEEGKSYLTQLWSKLHQTGTATLSSNVAIAGMGGVGKTSLALEYAHKAKNKNVYNLIHWLPSGTKDSLLEGYKKLLWEMDISTIGKDEDDIIDLVKNEVPKKGTSLLIYDNVPQFYGDVPAPVFLQGNTPKHAHVLITSRLAEGWGEPINLDVFPRQDSIEYLLKVTNLAPTTDHKNIAGELADALGNLPLALAHAAHYIKLVGGKNLSKKTFEEYLKDFKKLDPLAYLEENKDPLTTPESKITYENLIGRTLRLSTRLGEEHLSELAKELIGCSAYLNPDAIAEEIFLEHCQDKEKLKKALKQLSKLSLIKRAHHEDLFSIHRLVQLVIRHEEELKGNQEYKDTLLHMVSIFKSFFKKNIYTAEQVDKSLNNLSHILQLLEHSRYLKLISEDVDSLEWIGKVLSMLFNMQSQEEDNDTKRSQVLKKVSIIFPNAKNDGDIPEWLFDFAEKSYHTVQMAFHLMYDGGFFVPIDYTRSVLFCTNAAKQGNAEAQCKLGTMYFNGTKDSSLGITAEQKDIIRLGIMHANRQGAVKNDDKAFKWYTKAAGQGDAFALLFLGNMYENGQGIGQSLIKAFECYAQSAKLGNRYAQAVLGALYEKGLGTEQNYKKAFKYFSKAAQQGLDSAQCRLGEMYALGKGVDQSDDLAIEWFNKASDKGNADSQCFLGICYEKKKNEEEAIRYYTMAAKQGHACAQNSLGEIYKERGNVHLAFLYFFQAANQGHAKAQYEVGMMYYEGIGIYQSCTEGEEWIQKASEQGNEDAIFWMDEIPRLTDTRGRAKL